MLHVKKRIHDTHLSIWWLPQSACSIIQCSVTAAFSHPRRATKESHSLFPFKKSALEENNGRKFSEFQKP
jgi:hypothetical protein